MQGAQRVGLHMAEKFGMGGLRKVSQQKLGERTHTEIHTPYTKRERHTQAAPETHTNTHTATHTHTTHTHTRGRRGSGAVRHLVWGPRWPQSSCGGRTCAAANETNDKEKKQLIDVDIAFL